MFMGEYIFIEQDIRQLREDIRTLKYPFFIRLFDQCELYKKEVLYQEHPPKSTTYMGMAIANLSLMYLLTNQKQYLEEAKRWIFTVVNYPHWGNAHLVDVDLSASWILFGLSLGYNWLKADLTEKELDLIKQKLNLQAVRMYDYKISTEGSGWSTNYWQNHNWINLTGLATAGYVLMNDFSHAMQFIETSKFNFNFVLDYLPEDGSDYEGVVYWRYG